MSTSSQSFGSFSDGSPVHSFNNDDDNSSIQSKYLKMINDTNLLDSCAAATEETESIRKQASTQQLQFLETKKSPAQGTTADLQQLMQWIVYMERYVEALSPNWQQVNGMNEEERNKRFNEQSELRQYIASHYRIFNTMIKEEHSERTRNVQDKFNKLLLIAIEKQCLLEAYPVMLKASDSQSDATTIITSNNGIKLPTHTTNSKRRLLSEDECSSPSLYLDFQQEKNQENCDDMKLFDTNVRSPSNQPLKNNRPSNSLMSEYTLQLIKNVDSFVPATNWFVNRPNASFENNLTSKISSSRFNSNIRNCASIRFQSFYNATPPMLGDTINSVLYFGENYDDALNSESSSTMPEVVESSTSTPTMSSNSEQSRIEVNFQKDKFITNKTVNRKRKRALRKSNKTKDTGVQDDVPKDTSELALDILLIVEDLRNNYKSLKPQDFDGILKICRENLGCLIAVLDKGRRSHCVRDDTIYIQENCKCGIIDRFLGRIVWFLYHCSRKIRKCAIYRFLMGVLRLLYIIAKTYYLMATYLNDRVRFHRSIQRAR